MPVSEIPCQQKRVGFTPSIAMPTIAMGMSIWSGGSRGTLPQKKFNMCTYKMPFSAIWDHSQWKIVEFFHRLHWIRIRSMKKSSATRACHKWMQTLNKVEAIQCISEPNLPQSYARIPKGKNGWETTEKQRKWQRIMLKRLVKQRKHYLSLAGKSFKNQENMKQKWEARNVLQKRKGGNLCSLF